MQFVPARAMWGNFILKRFLENNLVEIILSRPRKIKLIHIVICLVVRYTKSFIYEITKKADIAHGTVQALIKFNQETWFSLHLVLDCFCNAVNSVRKVVIAFFCASSTPHIVWEQKSGEISRYKLKHGQPGKIRHFRNYFGEFLSLEHFHAAIMNSFTCGLFG